MLIKEGKTNIKYLLIVVILAAIVGGGVFWCITKQEIPFTQSPDVKTPEGKTEEVKIYFYNMDLYNELSENICPDQYCPGEMYETYGVDDCGPFFPVTRNISEQEDKNKLVEFLITELQKGPTEEEQNKGFKQKSPFIEMIETFKLESETLTLVFNKEKLEEWEETIAPRSFESLSSCEGRLYFYSITKTLGQVGVGEINFEGIVF